MKKNKRSNQDTRENQHICIQVQKKKKIARSNQVPRDKLKDQYRIKTKIHRENRHEICTSKIKKGVETNHEIDGYDNTGGPT